MDNSFDDIFNRKVEDHSEATETVETAPETTTDEISEPVEIKTEEATETATETEAKTEEKIEDDKGRIPSNLVTDKALIAVRRRAQAAEQRASEAERRIREIEMQQRQANVPDPFENPTEHNQWLEGLVEQQLTQRMHDYEHQRQQQMMFQQTEELFKPFKEAAVNYSQEQIAEAISYAASYAESDDAWGQEMLKSADPVARILEEKTRHAQQAAEWTEYSRNPQEFLARKAAELSLAGASTASANQPQMAVAAPRSLASAGSAAAVTPTAHTAEEAFNAIFNNKR